MKDQILDDHFVKNQPGRPRSTLMNWSSTLFLWAGILACIAKGLYLDWQVLLAGALLGITTVISYLNFSRGVRMTFLLIGIGLFGGLTFFPIEYTMGIGFLQVNIMLLVVGLVHFYTNKDQLSTFLKGILKPDIPEDEIKAIGRSQIDNFKTRFAHKNLSELTAITENNKLLPEAIQAAEELLEERDWV